MFSIGQYVSCGNKGVCTIENVTTLDISGVDRKKMYYILKPYYMAASTVYVPVDSSATSIRPILTREEAQELLEKISDIPMLTIQNEKLIEQDYKTFMPVGRSAYRPEEKRQRWMAGSLSLQRTTFMESWLLRWRCQEVRCVNIYLSICREFREYNCFAEKSSR